MKKPSSLPICCGKESVWVDNVPNKEYCYCRKCKKEVLLQSSPIVKALTWWEDAIVQQTQAIRAQIMAFPTFMPPTGYQSQQGQQSQGHGQGPVPPPTSMTANPRFHYFVVDSLGLAKCKYCKDTQTKIYNCGPTWCPCAP